MVEKLCELRKKGGGGAKYTETSLWTNSAPTSTFGAQAVTLSQSMADFKYLKIKVAPSTTSTSGQYFEDIVLVSELQRTQSSVQEGVRDRLVLGFARTTYDYERPYYYASNTSIYFMATAQAGTSTTSNGRNIPIEILGLNELAHGKRFDETTLWTNNAPTSSFSSKTINLSDDITNYDYIKINYRVSTTVSTEAATLVSVSDLLKMTQTANTPKFAFGGYIAASYTRAGYCPSTTSIYISSCYQLASTSEVNNGAIPTSIVGCKFR